jgi:hypothetical protein
MISRKLPKILNNVIEYILFRGVEIYFQVFFAFIDCTEQQIPRPKEKRRKERYYSGKKKKLL